jgi:E3 ubiquitin-protein ligase RNF14
MQAWEMLQDYVVCECIQIAQDIVDELKTVDGLEIDTAALLDEWSAVTEANTPSTAANLAMVLSAHDAHVRQQLFASVPHECHLCLEAHGGKECVLLHCGHAFGQACLHEYWAYHIQAGSVEGVRCPEPKCDTQPPSTTLESIVGHALTERFVRVARLRAAEQRGCVDWCPRDNCAMPATSDGVKFAQCQQCQYAFCRLCRKLWHGSAEPCKRGALDDLIEMYRAATDEERAQMRIEYSVSVIEQVEYVIEIQDRRTKETELSYEWVEDQCARCPQCRSSINKVEGCNHIKCSVCTAHFCYLCSKGCYGYEHWSEHNGTCYGMLFATRDQFKLKYPYGLYWQATL